MFSSKVIFFTFCLHVVASFSVNFKTVSTVFLPYEYTPTPQFALDMDAAEQMAYDQVEHIIYSVGKYSFTLFRMIHFL